MRSGQHVDAHVAILSRCLPRIIDRKLKRIFQLIVALSVCWCGIVCGPTLRFNAKYVTVLTTAFTGRNKTHRHIRPGCERQKRTGGLPFLETNRPINYRIINKCRSVYGAIFGGVSRFFVQMQGRDSQRETRVPAGGIARRRPNCLHRNHKPV